MKKRGEKKNDTKKEGLNIPLKTLWLGLTAWIILSTYVGYGIGGGTATKRKIESGDFSMDHYLKFYGDSTVIPVKLIGNNSGYVFYLTEGSKSVTIAPV